MSLDIVKHIIVHEILGIKSGSGSGDNTIIVKDETDSPMYGIDMLRFIGADVIAIADPVTPTTANIYIPTVGFADKYNENTAAVTGPGTTSRRIAGPTSDGSPFYIGSWTEGDSHPATNVAVQVFDSNAQASFTSTTSTIEVNVYGHTGSNVLATHTTAAINSNTDVTVSNIRIQVTSWAPDEIKYKARIIVDVDIDSIISNGGRFSVEIIHHDVDDRTYISTERFYDPNPNPQSAVGTATITENTAVGKWLSGIKYYILGDTFDIGATGLANLNSQSFPADLVKVFSASEYGVGDITLTGEDLTSWTTKYNHPTASYSATKAITETNFRFIGTTGNISAQVFDWAAGATADSGDASIAVDTWTQESTELAEYFTDEAFRVTSTYTAWDSTQDMTSYDDNLGMMLQNGVLKTRSTNWKTYAPGTSGNPDYSGFSGWGTYYRKFQDLSQYVRGSVSLSISGFTLAQLEASTVRMWIYIPGRFTSLCPVHGPDLFNASEFNGDNDPIRKYGSTTNTILISFGNLGLNPTNDYFIMKLEIQSAAINPDSIVVSW